MEREEKKPWAALLGCSGTKRKSYLEDAAKDIGLQLLFIGWNSWGDGFWDNWLMEHGTAGILKIDPPLWESAKLSEFPCLIDEYQKQLEKLEKLGEDSGISFLNSPQELGWLLDKRVCKTRLAKAGLPVTKEILSARSMEELLAVMEDEKVSQVFIKPNLGSGALGVTAFRVQHRTGRMVLYTCADWEPEYCCLVNTKKLRRIEKKEEISAFLNQLLLLDCIIERWYAKAEHDGYTYDLRAVIQDGKTDFLLARLSKGPITNLQLNNRPLPVEKLNLPANVLISVEELCQEAVRLYPGIRSVGIDILLEKRSLKPRIIEMNGQGDLIYQDIYDKNLIYRHQAKMLRSWLEEKGE